MSAEDPDDKVSYGRPPRQHRFKPGQSGNPRGRPRKIKRPPPLAFDYNAMPIIQLMRKAVGTPVTVKNQLGKAQMVSLLEAMLKRLALDAAQGMRGAQNQLLRMMLVADERDLSDRRQRFGAAIAHVTSRGQQSVAAKMRGLPAILPHPADFEWDLEVGTVTLRGPSSHADLKEYGALLDYVDNIVAAVELIAVKAEKSDNHALIEEWLRLQAEFDAINDVLPVSLQRFLPGRSDRDDASRPGDRSPTEHHRKGAISAAEEAQCLFTEG